MKKNAIHPWKLPCRICLRSAFPLLLFCLCMGNIDTDFESVINVSKRVSKLQVNWTIKVIIQTVL